MVMERSNFKTIMNSKVSSSTENFRVMAYLNQIHILMREISGMGNTMDKENIHGALGICMKGHINLDKKVDLEFTKILMDLAMKECG